jgi:hypothetical protein
MAFASGGRGSPDSSDNVDMSRSCFVLRRSRARHVCSVAPQCCGWFKLESTDSSCCCRCCSVRRDELSLCGVLQLHGSAGTGASGRWSGISASGRGYGSSSSSNLPDHIVRRDSGVERLKSTSSVDATEVRSAATTATWSVRLDFDTDLTTRSTGRTELRGAGWPTLWLLEDCVWNLRAHEQRSTAPAESPKVELGREAVVVFVAGRVRSWHSF